MKTLIFTTLLTLGAALPAAAQATLQSLTIDHQMFALVETEVSGPGGTDSHAPLKSSPFSHLSGVWPLQNGFDQDTYSGMNGGDDYADGKSLMQVNIVPACYMT